MGKHLLVLLFSLIACISYTKEKGGTGFGLAITKQMIEAMSSSINFTSTLGKGTTLNVFIPLENI